MKKIIKNKKTFFTTGSDAPGCKDFWVTVEKNAWESDTYQIFDMFLDSKYSYIDIGAWIGPTALYGCQLAKHCYAIEPDPEALKVLQANIALNPDIAKKITLFEGCITDKCGKAKLGTKTSFGDSMSSLLFGEEGGLNIESMTLEEFIKKNNIDDCNFIKMDIEGGEAVVLPNIKEYLQKNMPTLFLSLHPFFFKNKEKDALAVISALKVYPHIYLTDGRSVKLDKLLSIMLSMNEVENFSVIAVRKWNIWKRIELICRQITTKVIKRLYRATGKSGG